ncbi:G-type lectin S-receptor-like serine/threonine-protein kinase At4g27290 [Cornus florida]|uniref:G-type lectin S-receptor-like serine/threonine-protein kinase At4g27290 n=1 Tax=Cornus florida TaxID=4283 RepID=UPI0028A27D12|nr:G-type lectin S-receptor-like serine/threonine-protein kinase At4g27290 [Cornus florida]
MANCKSKASHWRYAYAEDIILHLTIVPLLSIIMSVLSSAVLCHTVALIFFHTAISIAIDTLSLSQSIIDGQTLVSAREKFQLGFFSPNNSNNRYLGIWYYNITPQAIVWVANRNYPINDSSGAVKIGDDGNLILFHHTQSIDWSINYIKNMSSKSIVAQLLDSGNLVLRDESNGFKESNLWQSFDHPSDTLLTGMKLGWDLRIGLNRYLTSWKSEDDPSPGEFTYSLNHKGPPHLVLRKGSVKIFRSATWDGVQFRGFSISPDLAFIPKVISNTEEVYFESAFYNDESTLTRLMLSHFGESQRLVWNSSSLEWVVKYKTPSDDCDNYAVCGPNAICTISDLSMCSCLTGYMPKSSQDWEEFKRSGGCIRKNQLNCPAGEEFIEIAGVKMPDLLQFWVNTTMTIEECKAECLKKCSCTAYANLYATNGGSSCLLCFRTRVQVIFQDEKEGGFGNHGINCFLCAVHCLSYHLEEITAKNGQPKFWITICQIGGPVRQGLRKHSLTVCHCFALLKYQESDAGIQLEIQSRGEENLELPIFDMFTVAEATHNFSPSNKIGEGGFGPVYKGQLSTGLEIAVKRLSQSSHQGLNEFKNERAPYLHRDSRLRIIHRDLKASNVLLDTEMNPKISDFGTAIVFGGDQSSAKTNTVVGTYGYISPEYAIGGIFSIKSDVFSFGVLVLEIAWKLWDEEKASELIDPLMEDLFPMSEVLRCMQVGLLCVQQRPEDRPTMSSVLLMLDSESAMLPQPKQPGFYTLRSPYGSESSLAGRICTTNEGRTYNRNIMQQLPGEVSEAINLGLMAN